MFFDGSFDTEDWSNDAENSALHHVNKLYFTIYSHRKKSIILNCNIISQYCCFYCIFDQINTGLVNFVIIVISAVVPP